MKSFGLTPTGVTAVTDKGSPVTLTLSDAPGPSPLTEAAREDPEKRIAETLFLLDKFGISNECYHELAQVTNVTLWSGIEAFSNSFIFAGIAPELPYLHQVKSLRKVLNLGVELTRLPFPITCYYLDVRVLTTTVLSSLVGK